jgi:hypothetical protein
MAMTSARIPDSGRTYGDTIHGLSRNGQEVRAAVFNEHQVRAAAGLTLAAGAVALAYASLAKVYVPIQAVTVFFFFDFLLRVTLGIRHSPTGIVGGWMTRRQAPEWASAKPKRFAWTLGLGLALAMAIITNVGIRGALPLTICLVCLTLMWMEAVLGLCLGCEIHRFMVGRGWIARDEAFEICSPGACAVDERR